MMILYDHQVTSLQDAGGVSRYHYELACHLLQAGDVDIGVYLGLNRSVYPYARLRNRGARICSARSPISPGRVRYLANELITGSLLLGQHWDIYHPTRHRTMPMVRARGVVITNHDCTQERFPQLFRNAQRTIRFKSQSFRDADIVICVSRSSQQDVVHLYGLAESKTRVIHHGLSRLPVPSQEKSSQQVRPYILYVGARPAYKNCAALLQAFAESGLRADFDLLLLGGGPLSVSERQQIKSLGIERAVRQKDARSDTDLAQAYSRCALFVYPSLYEGFGFPPLEAMSLGCLVVAARSSSIPEVCGDVPYYFDPNDVSDLATVMVTALNASDQHERILAGRKLADSYHWSACANHTLEVYREVI